MRENKYNYLFSKNIASTKWTELNPLPEHYFFVPRSSSDGDYKYFYKINDIFGISSSGIQTKRDKIAINLNRDNLLTIINDFAKMDADEIRIKFDLPKDGRDWKIEWASEHASEILKRSDRISQILYRPFDIRWTIIDNKVKGLVAYPRFEVMQHMQKENLGLILTRQLSLNKFQHVSVTRNPIDGNTISLQTREYNYLFPLYLNASAIDESYQKRFESIQFQVDRISQRIPNLNPDFISSVASRLGLEFVSDGHGDLSSTFGPEDIFDYIYAVFHSPTYRQRYAEFLKIDFPRVPMTSSPELFRKLCILGEELVALHLLESPYLSQLITRYPVAGDNVVEKGFPKFVAYEEGAPGYVYINQAPVLRGRSKGGLGVSCGRLPGLREVAQGPAGQAALLRRPHALSEGGGGPEGDGTADGGDRQGHSRLAHRVRGHRIPCSATRMTAEYICASNLAVCVAQIHFCVMDDGQIHQASSFVIFKRSGNW